MAPLSAAQAIALCEAGAPKCATCKRQRIVMIAMTPGPDRKEWWLCPKCYAQGTTKMNGEPNEITEKPSKKTRETKSKAKDEAGSFEKHPNEPEPGSQFAWTGGTGTYIPDDDNFW